MARYNPAEQRKRGRAGMEQRLRRLAAEPLCRKCKETGVVRLAATPDHIIPLALGGTDDDSNIQCLCEECHAIKTALESASSEAASNHPGWLKPSAIPLKIVSGPPCAGKTTYLQENARQGDITIDLDSIMMKLNPRYKHWSQSLDGTLVNRAIRVRNDMLGSLSRMSQGRAFFIVSAPTKEERAWWQAQLGGEVVLLHPGVEECERRAVTRGTPNAIAGIAKWEQAAALPWRPKGTPFKGVDVSGRPIGHHPWNKN